MKNASPKNASSETQPTATLTTVAPPAPIPAQSKDRIVKTPIMAIGVGNGGIGIIAWLIKEFSKDSGAAIGKWLLPVVVDTDGAKLRAFSRELPTKQLRTSIPQISLLNSNAGTGANVKKGRDAVAGSKKKFEDLADQIAAIEGIVFLCGCGGGGSTGAMPPIAEIFIKKNVPVLCWFIMPPITKEGEGRSDNARKVIRELDDVGVSVLTSFNSLATKYVGSMQQRYDAMNDKNIGPSFKILRHVFQDVGSVINVDRNDLLNVMRKRSRLHFGFYIKPKDFNGTSTDVESSQNVQKEYDADGLLLVESQKLADIYEALFKPELQRHTVLSRATRGLLISNGTWSGGLLDKVHLESNIKMLGGQSKQLKLGINETIKPGESEWICLIAAADHQRDEEINEEAGINGESASTNGTGHHKGSIAVISGSTNNGHEQSEQLVEKETLLKSPLNSQNYCKKVRLPKSLFDLWQTELTRAPRDAGRLNELVNSVQNYINRDPNLTGWSVCVPPEMVSA